MVGKLPKVILTLTSNNTWDMGNSFSLSNPEKFWVYLIFQTQGRDQCWSINQVEQILRAWNYAQFIAINARLAFDSMWHEGLLYKTKAKGTHSFLISLTISSLLNGCTNYQCGIESIKGSDNGPHWRRLRCHLTPHPPWGWRNFLLLKGAIFCVKQLEMTL